MTKVHSFIEKLQEFQPWAERLGTVIGELLIRQRLRDIPYDTPENITLQRKGIDFIVTSSYGDWEAKVRGDPTYYNRDILLELVSVKESGKRGWAYTSQADAIVYCWLNESKTNFMRVGYIILIKELRKTDWFKQLAQNYIVRSTKSERDGEKWTTEFVTPSIHTTT